MKKKAPAVSVSLFLCLSLLLTACGNGTTETPVESGQNQRRQSMETQPSQQDPQQDATAGTAFSRGKWQDNIYTSDFFQLQFTLPEGWVHATDEEIAATMSLGKEILADENKYMAELADLTTVYDMMANDVANGSSLVVMAEKQTLDSVTAEVYINTLKGQLEEITSLRYEVGEPTSQEIAGQNFVALPTSLPDSSIEQYYYARRQGDYMVAIILSGSTGSGLPELLNQFAPVG